MDIGKRIKQLRMKNDLTLADLASRCELTKGFLSQLERNLTSPSISTLENITEVLGVSLQEFFTEEKSEKYIFTKDDFYIDEKENCKITYLVPNSQKNKIDPIILELREKGESQDIYPFEGEEFGLVLQGSIELLNISANSRKRIKKGECFYLYGNCTHRLLNKSSYSKVLWVATPSIF